MLLVMNMQNSIYDILGKRLNIIKEYDKLYEMFVFEHVYLYNNRRYSLAEIFDEFIDEWDYRSTYTNIDEIMEELTLDDTTTEDTALRDILYLIELILNVNEYIKEKISIGNFNFARPGMLCLIDKKILC